MGVRGPTAPQSWEWGDNFTVGTHSSTTADSNNHGSCSTCTMYLFEKQACKRTSAIQTCIWELGSREKTSDLTLSETWRLMKATQTTLRCKPNYLALFGCLKHRFLHSLTFYVISGSREVYMMIPYCRSAPNTWLKRLRPRKKSDSPKMTQKVSHKVRTVYFQLYLPHPPHQNPIYIQAFFLNVYFIYLFTLASPGLRWGMWHLLVVVCGLIVAAHQLLVAACGI